MLLVLEAIRGLAEENECGFVSHFRGATVGQCTREVDVEDLQSDFLRQYFLPTTDEGPVGTPHCNGLPAW